MQRRIIRKNEYLSSQNSFLDFSMFIDSMFCMFQIAKNKTRRGKHEIEADTPQFMLFAKFTIYFIITIMFHIVNYPNHKFQTGFTGIFLAVPFMA
jgi:hypothetical protein